MFPINLKVAYTMHNTQKSQNKNNVISAEEKGCVKKFPRLLNIVQIFKMCSSIIHLLQQFINNRTTQR